MILYFLVSVGGTTGLFVGASLLSFVELIFYFTVRFAGNFWIVKKENKNDNEQKTASTRQSLEAAQIGRRAIRFEKTFFQQTRSQNLI